MFTRFILLALSLWVLIGCAFVAIVTGDGTPFLFAGLFVLAIVCDMRRVWLKDHDDA